MITLFLCLFAWTLAQQPLTISDMAGCWEIAGESISSHCDLLSTDRFFVCVFFQT
jgi:hypothetical protein